MTERPTLYLEDGTPVKIGVVGGEYTHSEDDGQYQCYDLNEDTMLADGVTLYVEEAEQEARTDG